MRTQMKFPIGWTPAGGHGGHWGSALLLSSHHLHGSHGQGREPRSALTHRGFRTQV